MKYEYICALPPEMVTVQTEQMLFVVTFILCDLAMITFNGRKIFHMRGSKSHMGNVAIILRSIYKSTRGRFVLFSSVNYLFIS